MRYIYEVKSRLLKHRIDTFTRYEELRKVNISGHIVEVYSAKNPAQLINVLKTEDDIEGWIVAQERAETWCKNLMPVEESYRYPFEKISFSLPKTMSPNTKREWDPFEDTDIQLINEKALKVPNHKPSLLSNENLSYSFKLALIDLIYIFKLSNGQSIDKSTIKKWLEDDLN
jgi:hypothetical protein